MGIFKKDELMLDFKGVKTEDMSSTIPYMSKLNADAKMLVNQLNPNTVYNNKGLVLFNESEQYDMYKLFEKSTNLNNNDNNFSETSPFISSDVYNQLLNKLKSQKGGYNEDRDDDFEEESSTTSSESSESDKKKKNIKKFFKKSDEDDEVDIEPEEEEEFSEMSAGSYLSSSAHTNGTYSSDDSDNSKSYQSDSHQTSTVSVRNHRNRNMSDSVNTSDINIISLEH